MGVVATTTAHMPRLTSTLPRRQGEIFVDELGDVLAREPVFRLAAEQPVLKLPRFCPRLLHLDLEFFVSLESVGMPALPVARLGAKRGHFPTQLTDLLLKGIDQRSQFLAATPRFHRRFTKHGTHDALLYRKRLPMATSVHHLTDHPDGLGEASREERRVGKECRSRWSPYH